MININGHISMAQI